MRSVRLTQRPIFQMVVRMVFTYTMKYPFLGDFQSVFHMPGYIPFSALLTIFEQWRGKFNLARGSLGKCSRAQICLLWFDLWLLGIENFCTIDSCWINSVYNLSTYKWSSLMPGTASRSEVSLFMWCKGRFRQRKQVSNVNSEGRWHLISARAAAFFLLLLSLFSPCYAWRKLL